MFHLTLAISRLIDIHPIAEKQKKVQKFIKETTTSWVVCETIERRRPEEKVENGDEKDQDKEE